MRQLFQNWLTTLCDESAYVIIWQKQLYICECCLKYPLLFAPTLVCKSLGKNKCQNVSWNLLPEDTTLSEVSQEECVKNN